MTNKKYVKPEIEVVNFDETDVIATSIRNDEDKHLKMTSSVDIFSNL